MYRTFDRYSIRFSRPVLRDSLESLHEMLEKHELINDFKDCFDGITTRKFEFTAMCSYKHYKKFFAVLYQVFGPFIAEISFNEVLRI